VPTVLVVDDSAADRQLVGGLLKKDPDLTVSYVSHGAEALARMERQLPDLVLAELVLAEMDGLELVTAIRNKYPRVPVILMTSRGTEDAVVQALRCGAASYVPKRSLARDLLSTVENVLSVAAQQRVQRRLLECVTRSEHTFVLQNDSTLFHPLISFIQEAAGQMGLCDGTDRTRLGVALEEALANALYHGNLEMSSQLREEDDAHYQALIDERRQQSPYRDRRIYVEVALSRRQAVFAIRDEGRGFNPTTLPDPTDPANLEKVSGRGVLLMRSFMDEVTYNAEGNQVTMVKYAATACR
jgi:CheY-like chemotaxis protein